MLGKYRVWCSDRNEWERDAIFLSDNGTPLHYLHGDIRAIRSETHKVSFFTGLLDKNGKEIFQGDIIRILLRRHMEDSVFANAEIHFEGAAFWFNAPKVGFTDCNWHFYNQADREVIGNIYENPELLK